MFLINCRKWYVVKSKLSPHCAYTNKGLSARGQSHEEFAVCWVTAYDHKVPPSRVNALMDVLLALPLPIRRPTRGRWWRFSGHLAPSVPRLSGTQVMFTYFMEFVLCRGAITPRHNISFNTGNEGTLTAWDLSLSY